MSATQVTRHKVIAGRRFLQALLDAGVVTVEENVTRVVIDAPAGGFVKLYVERAGDERLLEVARNTALEIRETTP
jgi:proline racemase